MMMPKRIIFQFISFQFLLSVFYSICSRIKYEHQQNRIALSIELFFFFPGTQNAINSLFLCMCVPLLLFDALQQIKMVSTKKKRIEFSCCKENWIFLSFKGNWKIYIGMKALRNKYWKVSEMNIRLVINLHNMCIPFLWVYMKCFSSFSCLTFNKEILVLLFFISNPFN